MNDLMKEIIEARDRLNAFKRVSALWEYPQVQISLQAKVWSGEANMHEVAQIPLTLRIEKDIRQYVKLQIKLLEDKIAKMEGQLKQKK